MAELLQLLMQLSSDAETTRRLDAAATLIKDHEQRLLTLQHVITAHTRALEADQRMLTALLVLAFCILALMAWHEVQLWRIGKRLKALGGVPALPDRQIRSNVSPASRPVSET